MGEAVSGPADELNPLVKPKVSLDDPIRSYADWVKAVSLLTETTRYKFPRFLPSVVRCGSTTATNIQRSIP